MHLCLGIKQTLHLLQNAQNVELAQPDVGLPPPHTPLFLSLYRDKRTNTTLPIYFPPKMERRSGFRVDTLRRVRCFPLVGVSGGARAGTDTASVTTG